VAVELVRKSQDARLEEQARNIADLEAQLQKAQAEKEASRRAQEGLRKQVEQVTREKKEKEAQLLQKGKELVAEKETVKTLRSSLEIARQEWEESELRLIFETQAKEDAKNAQLRLAEQYQRLLFDTSQQRDDLSLRNQKLARQLAAAKDKQEVQLAKLSASKSRLQLQARLENAHAEIGTLKQRLRSVEKELSSSTKMLAAKAQQKQLPAVRQTLPVFSAQTSLAVANRSIHQLTSENRRLQSEWMEARESARQWEENFRRLAKRLAEVEDRNSEHRRRGRQSELEQQTEGEKPGFFARALAAIGLIGTGAVLGAGAAAMLGPAPQRKVLGPTSGRKALGPGTQRLLPPKSNS
jgi:hypothetical protein